MGSNIHFSDNLSNEENKEVLIESIEEKQEEKTESKPDLR